MIPIKKHISELRPSDTLTINQLFLSRQEKGLETYRFGFGQSPFPVPEIVQEALRQNAYQKDYLPVNGLSDLRQAVADHTNDLLDGGFGADEVFIGPGSKELIYLIQMVLEGPLIIPSPSWVSYIPQALISNKEIIQVNTPRETWNIEAKELGKTLLNRGVRKGILLLNYPNNPTGRTYSDLELKSLAEVARKHELLVISDEIYGLLNFSGEYRSIARYYPEATIITSGLSKWCGAGGWRLGTAIIPSNLSPLYNALCTTASETFSAVSAPIQYAACVAFQPSQEIDEYLQASIQILRRVSNYCHRILSLNEIPTLKSQGGFYLFPDLTKVLAHKYSNSSQLCERILEETGVALLPGIAFGRPKSELTFRLSYVDFDGVKALKHKDPDVELRDTQFEELFPRIAKGMQSLVNWINRNRS